MTYLRKGVLSWLRRRLGSSPFPQKVGSSLVASEARIYGPALERRACVVEEETREARVTNEQTAL